MTPWIVQAVLTPIALHVRRAWNAARDNSAIEIQKALRVEHDAGTTSPLTKNGSGPSSPATGRGQ